MKIGLLTFHRQLNYGGVLQALALRDTLAELSSDEVETIDLWMNPRDMPLLGKVRNPNLPLYARVRNWWRARRRPFGREAFEVRREKTIRLLHDRLHLSAEQYRTSEDLRRLPAYETVVVGSDQVWNYDLVRAFPTNPWLTAEFPEGQDRIAYAASFGVTELPPELLEAYRDGMRRFRGITIREASGCELFRQVMGADAARWPEGASPVLDPTLLRTEDAWRKEIEGRGQDGEYLLCYWLDGLTPERLRWMERVSRHYGQAIVLLISGPMQWMPENVPWLKVRFDADPLDFVALIAGASGIITDSFHGLQFSSLFRRRISIFLGRDRTGISATSRFYDFCSRYGVSEACKDINRIYDSPEVGFVDLSRLNWALFSEDRNSSLNRLKQMLITR